MADWKKYGLEDFAEIFDKYGIHTEQQLMEAAPRLEEMGLKGLCDAIGAPKPRKAQVPQTTKTTSGNNTQKSGGSKLDKIRRTLNKLLVATVAILLIIIVIMAKLS